jgi:DGQHR domain-containing protein
MITVPARRVKQFGVEFYQAGLSAKDIERLVKFEVLGYSGGPKEEPKKATRANRSRVNWDSLEKRIGESEAAYQRPVIRRKIDELVAYYREYKDAATLPAIPGAVIITSEKRFTFTPIAGHHDLGLLQIPEEHGVLRVLDGQHRLLALHALSQGGEGGETMGIEVPAVLFDSLDARQIVGNAPGHLPRHRHSPCSCERRSRKLGALGGEVDQYSGAAARYQSRARAVARLKCRRDCPRDTRGLA